MSINHLGKSTIIIIFNYQIIQNTNFGIKSVQSGTFTFDGLKSSQGADGIYTSNINININEVNVEKCIVIVNGFLSIVTYPFRDFRPLSIPYVFRSLSSTLLSIAVGCGQKIDDTTAIGQYNILSNIGSYQIIEFY